MLIFFKIIIIVLFAPQFNLVKSVSDCSVSMCCILSWVNYYYFWRVVFIIYVNALKTQIVILTSLPDQILIFFCFLFVYSIFFFRVTASLTPIFRVFLWIFVFFILILYTFCSGERYLLNWIPEAVFSSNLTVIIILSTEIVIRNNV